MYTFIHHEGKSTVYIQSKTDKKLLLQTDKTHTQKSCIHRVPDKKRPL